MNWTELNWTETERERQRARINIQKGGEYRERAAAAQGKNGGEIVLNAEQQSWIESSQC